MPPQLTRAELRTWFRLISGIRALLKALDRQLRDESGITHDDYEILSQLHRSLGRSMRMSALAREMCFSPSRLSHAMSRMEEAGWVERSPNQDDRRVVDARLTAQGVEVVERASVGHLALVGRLVFQTLGMEEAKRAADALDRVRRAAQGQAPDE